MIKSTGKKLFDAFNYTFMIVFCMLIVLPFMHIISISLSSKEALIKMSVSFWPKGWEFSAYKAILSDNVFLWSVVNTIYITIVVTILNLIIDVMAAYAFSKKFYGKAFFNYYFVLTMYFSGGLIPFYILMTNYLHLQNTYLSLILPALVNVFYIIVIRTQIESIPTSLVEAAIIDGATQSQVLFRIVVPSIVPTIAAIGMFIALGSWNSWFNVMLFINNNKMWTLQYYLRKLVMEKMITASLSEAGQRIMELGTVEITPENYQMAAIILVALPIVCIYPFVQKYFVKGILVGSVKE
ncbi:MAG: carbohydrate ABC transporter permease [Firmicutes bacterium]|nr:carbohydrate ABC transporter permease [Bacillota bacterium]